MLEVLAGMVGLGLSAAASSSGLITTARVLLPDMHRSLPWWFALGSLSGYTLGALLVAETLRLVSFTAAGRDGDERSRPAELALGLLLVLCAVALLRIRATATAAVLKMFRFYGRVRLDKGWIPRRLVLQGARNVVRPRGLVITVAAGLLLQGTASSFGEDVLGAVVYGTASVLAIVALIAGFQRAPDRNRLRIERARDWVTRNATGVAAAVAVMTGTALVLHSVIP